MMNPIPNTASVLLQTIPEHRSVREFKEYASLYEKKREMSIVQGFIQATLTLKL